MHAANFGRRNIVEGAGEAGFEFVEPRGQGGQSALAFIPPAGRQVEQSLGQTIALEPLCDRFRGMVVGKQKLDRGEARFRGCVESIEKCLLGEHHRQVGGELGQWLAPVWLERVAFRRESSSQGAKRRGDPGAVGRLPTPGLLRCSPSGRTGVSRPLWLAMTINGSPLTTVCVSYDFSRRGYEKEPLREGDCPFVSGEGWIGSTLTV